MPPTLETESGKPVDVTPVDAAAVDARFDRAMNDDGPDEQAPPKRTRRAPAADGEAAPRRARQPKEEKSRTVANPVATLGADARREGVKGLVQVAAVIPLAAYKATSQDAYLADAKTIALNADEIADACVKTADADPRFAAVLDRVCSAGPYAALIAVAFKVGSQIARNHKPTLALPGTVDPMELLTQPETAAEAA
jgi:hypothetical protein